MYRMLREFGLSWFGMYVFFSFSSFLVLAFVFRRCWVYFHRRFMPPTTFPNLGLLPHFLPRLCSHGLLLPPTMTHCPPLAPLLHQVGLAHLSSLHISLHAPFPVISIFFLPSFIAVSCLLRRFQAFAFPPTSLFMFP
jgi:hypothetical protein